MKRTIELNRVIATDAAFVWAKITDLRVYPRYFKYVTRVQRREMRVGESWTDWTNILFVPMKVSHEVTCLELNRKTVFVARVALGGTITETMTIDEFGSGVRVTAALETDLRLADPLVGRFVARRLTEMVDGALDTLAEDAAGASRTSAPPA